MRKNNMKIGFVYDFSYPFNVGGIEIRNYELAKRLVKKGHEVHFFCIKQWKGKDILKKEGIIYHGINVSKGIFEFSGERKISDTLLYSFKVCKAIFNSDLDVINIDSFPYLHVPFIKIVGLIKRIPTVTTWHGFWSYYWYDYKGYFIGLIGKFFEKLTCLISKNNIIVSKKLQSLLRKYNPIFSKGKKYVHIPNGIDKKLVSDSKKKSLKYDVLFVGRLVALKQVGFLLTSLSKVMKIRSNLRVAIIGDGPLLKDHRKLVQKLNIEKNVTFLGEKSQHDVFSYMKSSKTFVLPSKYEGFGMVLLEAIACGCSPLVFNSEFNCGTDLIKDNDEFIFSNHSEFESKLLKLIDSRKFKQETKKKSIEVCNEYDWSRIFNSFEKYLKTIVNK